MRTIWIAIVTAVLGSVIGLSLTIYETTTVVDRFEASYVEKDPDSAYAEPVMPSHAVIQGESTYDFGTLAQNQSGTCTFQIRNESVSPLILDYDGVSCGYCVSTEFSHIELASTEVADIKVTYTTHKEGPEFAEHLELRTNDPDNPILRVNITGYVTQAIRFSKREIALGSVSAGEDIFSDFRIYGYEDAPLEITSHEFVSERTANYFKLEITPLELDDFNEDEPRAKSAVRARLSMTKGKPLGPIKQTLQIAAKLGEKSTVAELPIEANIVSDIVLIGGNNFIKEQNLLRLRTIVSAVGHSTTLRIRIRGPYRDQVKLSVGKIDPPEILNATIGEPTILANGYLYPVEITIPKGAPSTNRLGSQQGKIGVVTIETTHPSAKELPIYVSFAIE